MTNVRGFLVGAERSGSTLLRLMLAHHPQLTWLHESEYFVDFMPTPTDRPPVAEFLKRCELVRGFDRFVAEYGIEINPDLSYWKLLDGFLAQIQNAQQTRLIGATVHRHFDRLVNLWPDGRYIHLVRDGRDVARSRIGMGWAGNVWVGAFNWVERERLWEKVRENLGDDQVCDVRYEQLIVEPEAVLSELCEFLGVAYDPQMLSYPDDSIYAAPDARLIFQWRKKLSEREIRLIEAVQSDVLVARNYPLSGLAQLRVGRVYAAVLRLHSRCVRLRFRLRRHGLRLFLADQISRRIGSPQWRRTVVRRLHEDVWRSVK